MFNRIALPTHRRAALSLLLAALASPAAHASILSGSIGCSASGDTLKCHLDQILHALYALAGILSVILLLVIAVALRIYLKNKASKQVRS